MSPDQNGSDQIGQTENSRTWGHRFYVIQLQMWHVDKNH